MTSHDEPIELLTVHSLIPGAVALNKEALISFTVAMGFNSEGSDANGKTSLLKAVALCGIYMARLVVKETPPWACTWPSTWVTLGKKVQRWQCNGTVESLQKRKQLVERGQFSLGDLLAFPARTGPTRPC